MNTCMRAQHHFLVFANKTTLAVDGACGHVSAYGLLGGCGHALLSMWVHTCFFSVICNERWALISFGNICRTTCHWICGYTLTISPSHTLPYYPQTNIPCVLISSWRPLGGTPTLNHNGRAEAKPTIGAQQRHFDWCCFYYFLNLFVFVLTAICITRHQNVIPVLAHSQHSCMQSHFTPTSSPPTPLHLIAISILAINCLSARTPGLVPTVAKDNTTLHIPHTPWQSIQKSLGCTPSSPHQRAFVCGACIGTEQVDVSLVSLFNPLFKQSRLHCFNIYLTWYLWHIKIWWQYLVPTYRVYTAPRYATIPKWTCWHVVSVLLNIWWSSPRYATIRILMCQHVMSVLLNIWW